MATHGDEIRYQVFVSSTFTDLKEEREKVLQAILENQAFPAGMELFPAADDDQFEFIKREIKSSDYYLVIIAGRYGSVAQDEVSFTEKEYDFAISIGKPVLTFLHKDIGKLIGDKLESSDRGKADLEKFRAKARKGHMVAHYENPDDLKAKVFHALVQSFNVKPMTGWVRAGQTSRTDLERIRELQERVLNLDAENKRLREIRDDAGAMLASGEHQISFTLDLSDLTFQNERPSIQTLDASATWDEMLLVVFPGGSSFVNERALRFQLLQWILRKCPKNVGSETWWEASRALSGMRNSIRAFMAVEQIRIVLHRQFTGLGMIAESRQTTYMTNPLVNDPRPSIETVWQLTEKGERYIASKRGFLLPTDK
jgi:hypothetical protein